MISSVVPISPSTLLYYNHRTHPGPLQEITKFEHTTVGKPLDNRQVEIRTWLEEHETTMDIAAWIVFDDLSVVIEHEPYAEMFQDHAVITEGDTGITMEDKEKALHLLQTQLEAYDANNARL